MFSVIFEVHPKPDQLDAYLGNAKMLRPDLEQIEGFVDNIRYRSLTHDGWILSHSGWNNEKALVRWRTQAKHHTVQQKGRDEIFLDYHLRVGQVTQDTKLSADHALPEQRLDETQIGDGTTIILIEGKRPAEWVKATNPKEIAKWLGLGPETAGLVSWDVFDAVLTPGDIMLLTLWRDATTAGAFRNNIKLPENARLRQVRVIRDYGMFDRREAPQYYPDAKSRATIHS